MSDDHKIERDLALARDAMRARSSRPMEPFRRARLWARIDGDRRERRSWWLIPAAAAVAAASAMIFLRTSNDVDAPRVHSGELRVLASGGVPGATLSRGDELPIGARVVADRGASIQLDGADLGLGQGAELTMTAFRSVQLELGAIEVRVAPSSSPVIVGTPEARVATLGGKLLVQRESGRTRVEAIEVEAETKLSAGDGEETAMRTGQIEVLHAERAEAPRTEPAAAAPRNVEDAVPEAPREPQRAEAPSQPQPRAELATAERVEEARKMIPRDAPRARAIAEDVLEAQPTPEIRVGAWMVVADALRLEGNLDRAAETYGRVVDSPAGGAFREEAMFRKAQLYVELGRGSEALELLQLAEARVSGGLLEPERTALAADVLLREGRSRDAASFLEKRDRSDARAVYRARLRVARALLDADPIRARRLLDPVLGGSDPSLAKEARDILEALPPGEVMKNR